MQLSSVNWDAVELRKGDEIVGSAFQENNIISTPNVRSNCNNNNNNNINTHITSAIMHNCVNFNKNISNNSSIRSMNNLFDNSSILYNTNENNSFNNSCFSNTSFVVCNVPNAGVGLRYKNVQEITAANNGMNIMCETDENNNSTSSYNIINYNNINNVTNNGNNNNNINSSCSISDNNVNGYTKQDMKQHNYNLKSSSSFNNYAGGGNSLRHFNVEYNHSDTNLFFRNLPTTIDDASLRKIFSTFGSVLSAAIMRDIHTGESLGTAFVRFEKHEDALIAMKYYVRHPYISTSDISQISIALNNSQTDDKCKGINAQSHKPLVVQWAKKVHDDAIVGVERLKRRKLFVRNIPVEITEQAIFALMQPFGRIEDVTLHQDTVPPPASAHPSKSTTIQEQTSEQQQQQQEEQQKQKQKQKQKQQGQEEQFLNLEKQNEKLCAAQAVQTVPTHPFVNSNGTQEAENNMLPPHQSKQPAATTTTTTSISSSSLPEPSPSSSALPLLETENAESVAAVVEEKKLIAFITFAEDGAAAAACEAIHNTCPFPECNGIPFMAKLADPNRRRHEIVRPAHQSFHHNRVHDMSLHRYNMSTHHGHNHKMSDLANYKNSICSLTPNEYVYGGNPSAVMYDSYSSTHYNANGSINNNSSNSNSYTNNLNYLPKLNTSNSFMCTNELCLPDLLTECNSLEEDVDYYSLQRHDGNDERGVRNAQIEQCEVSTLIKENTELSFSTPNGSYTPIMHPTASTQQVCGNHAMPYYRTNVPTFPMIGETNTTPKLREQENEVDIISFPEQSPRYSAIYSLTCTPCEERCTSAINSTLSRYLDTGCIYNESNEKGGNICYDSTSNAKMNSYSLLSLNKMGLTSETSCLHSCDSLTNSVTSVNCFPPHLIQQQQERENEQEESVLCDSLDNTTRFIHTTQSSPALTSLHQRSKENDKTSNNVLLNLETSKRVNYMVSSQKEKSAIINAIVNVKNNNCYVCANNTDSAFTKMCRNCCETCKRELLSTPVLSLVASHRETDSGVDNSKFSSPLNKSFTEKYEMSTKTHQTCTVAGERAGKRDVQCYRFDPYNLEQPRQIMSGNSVPLNSSLNSSKAEANTSPSLLEAITVAPEQHSTKESKLQVNKENKAQLHIEITCTVRLFCSSE